MTINQTAVASVIQDYAPQLFVDQVSKNSWLFNHIKERGGLRSPSSANGPRWRVKTAGSSSSAWFAEGAPAPASSDFSETEAQLAWGTLHDSMQITGLAIAELDAQPTTYIDQYLRKQTEDHLAQMAVTINTALLGGVTANGITGLTAGIDDTNTYAGINRAIVTNWASYINDNSGIPRAISLTLLDTVHNQLTQTILGNYDEIWTGSAQADAITALAAGNGIITQYQIVADPQSPRYLGFGGLSNVRCIYRGRPVFAIPGYPTGRVDFVDASKIWIEELTSLQTKELAQVNADMNMYFTYFLQAVFSETRMGCASLQDLS
jgi:hypothetical protein